MTRETDKTNLGGHKQNLVHPRTQEKVVVTPQETKTDSPVSIQGSLMEAWVGKWPTVRSGVLNTIVLA